MNAPNLAIYLNALYVERSHMRRTRDDPLSTAPQRARRCAVARVSQAVAALALPRRPAGRYGPIASLVCTSECATCVCCGVPEMMSRR